MTSASSASTATSLMARPSLATRPLQTRVTLEFEQPSDDSGGGRHKHAQKFPPSSSPPPAFTSASVGRMISAHTSGRAGSTQPLSGHASRAVDRGVQSQYRESSAQTLPFSPDYLVDESPSAEAAELIALSEHLSYQKGSLPATLRELAVIDALRERRAWESSLPPLGAPDGDSRRAAMIEAREWREWERREASMAADQSHRMRQLVDSVNARQSLFRANQQTELAHARALQAEQQQREAADREHEHRRLVRLLGKQRLAAENGASRVGGVGLSCVSAAPLSFSTPAPRRDVVYEYADFGSHIYAPSKRDGTRQAWQSRNQIVDFEIPAARQVSQLQRIQTRNQVMQTQRAPIKALRHRTVDQRIRALELLDAVSTAGGVDGCDTAAASSAPESRSLSRGRSRSRSDAVNVYKQFAPLVRPDTPTLPASATAAAAVSVAALQLQRILMGRAAQNAAWTERQRHLFLVHEMREGKAHFVDSAPLAQAQVVQPLSQNHEPARNGDGAVDGQDEPDSFSQPVTVPLLGTKPDVASDLTEWPAPSSWSLLDCLLGGLVSDALVSLHVDAVHHAAALSVSRLQLEAAFVRRVREAEEGGRRQAEQQTRNQRHHRQQLIAQAHHRSAQALTASLLQRASDRYAEERASEVDTFAESEAVTADPDETGTRALIDGLLSAVVFPTVARRLEQHEAQSYTKSRVLAANDALHHAVEQAIVRVTATSSSAAQTVNG